MLMDRFGQVRSCRVVRGVVRWCKVWCGLVVFMNNCSYGKVWFGADRLGVVLSGVVGSSKVLLGVVR